MATFYSETQESGVFEEIDWDNFLCIWRKYFFSFKSGFKFLFQHQQQIATTVQVSFIYLEVSITEPFIYNITCRYLASESSTNPFLWFFLRRKKM